MNKGIPTLYAGVQFRSRAEAKWAAFFDLIKWSWEYEPIDLPGYIPDFLVQGRLLTEVKGGACSRHELLTELGSLPERFSPYEKQIRLPLPTIWSAETAVDPTDCALPVCIQQLRAQMRAAQHDQEGWMYVDIVPKPNDLEDKGPLLCLGAFPLVHEEGVGGIFIGKGSDWAGSDDSDALFFECSCGVGVTSYEGEWKCQICGACSRRRKTKLDISKLWKTACNATQWRKSA